MAQALPTFAADSKTSSVPSPQSLPSLHTQLPPPPSYGSGPQLTGVFQQPLQPGLPPQQAPYGSTPHQYASMGSISPQQVPMGTLPQQYTSTGTMASQNMPLGTLPRQQSSQFGVLPQAQPATMGTPMMGQAQVPIQAQMAAQAQLGQQFQATQYAQCAMGNHARSTKYGIAGIIGAIIFFPIGLLCLFADQQEVCLRCGQRLA